MKRIATALICSLALLLSVTVAGAAQKTPAVAGPAAVEQAVVAAVNINTADLETLTTLPGIGPKMAERISAYREANGPFKRVEDLLNVKGIGEKVLEKLKPLVTV